MTKVRVALRGYFVPVSSLAGDVIGLFRFAGLQQTPFSVTARGRRFFFPPWKGEVKMDIEGKEFLTRLFVACSEDRANLNVGLFPHFCDLYEHMEEAEKSLKELDEISGICDEKTSRQFFAVLDNYEMQGFFNGFRIGVKMCREIGIS